MQGVRVSLLQLFVQEKPRGNEVYQYELSCLLDSYLCIFTTPFFWYAFCCYG